jgi:hypothetical protein
MKRILFVLSLLAVLFCGGKTRSNKIGGRPDRSANVAPIREYTNFYPQNDRDWHVGLEGSYLYWMIGTHTTYANVFQTRNVIEIALAGHNPILYLDEDLVEIIKGTSKNNSGYSVRLSFFNEQFEGWELGAKFQAIEFEDDPLNCCQRIFTDSEWYEYATDPNVPNFPIPAENNGLVAKLNIGLPGMFLHHSNHLGGHDVVFQLDKICETLDWKSLIIDLTNFGVLHQAKYINFGVSAGLEIDWFKNSIELRGGYCGLIAGGGPPVFFGLDPWVSAFFAYKLENNAFSIGPFAAIQGALRFEKPKHVFQLKGSLYGAGLYTQNRYRQDVAFSDLFTMTLEEYEAVHSGTAPASIYPQSSCEVQYTKPELCYNPQVTMYHAKVTLGVDYECLYKGMESHISIDWETNSFLNFFDRDFKVYSHDDLNYQGLTATIGFAF